jgi:hypothetical protein
MADNSVNNFFNVIGFLRFGLDGQLVNHLFGFVLYCCICFYFNIYPIFKSRLNMG